MRLSCFLLLLTVLASCSKKEGTTLPPVVIPDKIDGVVYEFNVTPVNITTPDKGVLLISMNNTLYRVEFRAAEQAASNAVLHFASDSILTNASREFANLGKDAVAYNPVADNEIDINFKDGRKIRGLFTHITNFGGTFGEQLIAQWRQPGDPARPNQKAKDDIRNFVQRYDDKDGPGPDMAPIYLSATVTKP